MTGGATVAFTPPWRRARAARRWGKEGKTLMSTKHEDGHPREPGADDLLSKRQLAQRLKKAPRTIDYWRKREGLPFLKIGHTVFFRWPDVMRHLEKTTGEAVARTNHNRKPAKAPPPSDAITATA